MTYRLPNLQNKLRPLYLIGQGYQNCVVPAFIQNHFLRNPHVYTPYTPYQAEISQGRLEMLYNYQSFMQTIFNKDIAVASLLDAGQVAMDIITLMKQHTKCSNIIVQDSCYQTLKNCINLRAHHQDIKILRYIPGMDITQQFDNTTLENTAGVIIQTPDSIGNLYQYNDIVKLKKQYPHILVGCNTDIMAHIHYDLSNLTKLSDFIFGNGGNVGVGLNYGGPQPAFLVSDKKFIRHLPGKIVGTSITNQSHKCYRLALQTREQHIKREKATSNICTNQALLANMSAAWMLFHGKDGLKKISNDIHEKTKYVLSELNEHNPENNRIVNDNFYNTLSFNGNTGIVSQLNVMGIYPYLNRKHNTMSFTFDETHNDYDIERFVRVIKEYQNKRPNAQPIIERSFRNHDKSLELRATGISINHMIENVDGPKEQALTRYLHKLANKDYSLITGMIPLGSCTMKYTPVDTMERITVPEMNIHPYIPLVQTPYDTVIRELSDKLKMITGFDEVFYQSQSGAMGEYAGLSVIHEYHRRNQDGKRNIILMPKSAHGTNASTSVLCGFKVKYLKECEDGMVDMEHFHSIVDKHGSTIAGLMITYPSTYGLFEKNIQRINQTIHEAGGLVYMDGANMNALMGREKSADLGFDICHFNLHKTFAIPHGGGGPGMGPIGLRKELVPFLPTFDTSEDCHSISTTPHGSGNILQISHEYTKNFTEDSVREFHNKLMKRTRDIIDELKHHFTIYHVDSPYRAHEFIIDCRPFNKYNVKDVDIAKRLMDYGFHAPTMSWPIHNSLMIEVTETESTQEINRFVNALMSIQREIIHKPEIVRNAPHSQWDVFNWKYDYSIQEGCYPVKTVDSIENKFWPNIGRINDYYGDVNMLKN